MAEKTDAEWRAGLTPEQYRILREKGTERAFTGKYWNHHARGVYACAGCGNPLFDSEAKFDSGTGWPSFTTPAAQTSVKTHEDNSHFMSRTEVLCRRCDSHLGHVFTGEGFGTPTDERWCINSVSLTLEPTES